MCADIEDKNWNKKLEKRKKYLEKKLPYARQKTINMLAINDIEKERYKHDNRAKERHRMAVEVLVDELRSKGHNIIVNPQFQPHRPDLIDQTTNTRYELQTNLYDIKLKELPKNTKIIPIKEAPYNKPGMKSYLQKYIVKGHKDK